MEEQQAAAVAEAIGGNTWNSGGGVWLVVLHRSDGKVVVTYDESAADDVEMIPCPKCGKSFPK